MINMDSVWYVVRAVHIFISVCNNYGKFQHRKSDKRLNKNNNNCIDKQMIKNVLRI